MKFDEPGSAPVDTPLPPVQIAARVTVACLAYLAATRIASLFPASDQVLRAIWPASGIALAALLLNPRRLWPVLVGALALCGFTSNIVAGGRPVASSLGFTAASVLEWLGCAYIVHRAARGPVTFERVREVLALAAGAIAVNGVTSVIGAGTATLMADAPFGGFYTTWWVSNGLGILLVAPVIVSWRRIRDLLQDRVALRGAEAAAFWVAWCLFASWAFDGDPLASPWTPQPYMLAVLLAWPALRVGQRGVTSALLALAVIGIVSSGVVTGPSPLGGDTPQSRMVLLQIYLGITSLSGLLLAASYAQSKEAERAAQENGARLRALGDNIPDGMVYQVVRELDGRARFLYVSEGVTRLNGVTSDAVLRDARALYDLVIEEDRARLAAAEAASLAGMSVFSQAVRIRRPDGEIRWIDVASAPRRLPDGRVVWDGIQTDITKRKHSEAERDKLQAELAQAQKMDSIGRLAGGVAHDFNNMLGVIIGHAEMALDELDVESPVRKDLEALHHAATRSADLTRQLLAFARRQTATPRLLDLNATVEGMLKMLRRLMGENLALKWAPEPGLCPVLIDPAQVDQILANLCLNARDAVPDVGTITIRTRAVTLDAAFCAQHRDLEPGEYALLEVRDTGSGMPPEVLASVFEPFFTTKSPGRGTGLGLSTVFGIVKQNRGHIDVDSMPGAGTTVRVYLPRAAGESVEAAAAAPTAIPHGHGETILLVEDEPDLLEIGAEMIERLGYAVLSAATPGAALDLARAHGGEIRLVITDVVMPEMNGLELVTKVKADLPGMPCLFTSGYTADVIATSGVLNEGVHFIQKPFSMQTLALRIHEALARSGTRPPDTV